VIFLTDLFRVSDPGEADKHRALEAERLHRRALAIFEAAYPPIHPDRLAVLKGYAQLLRATGRTEQAAAMERAAKGA
jgi:hypothetical protein